VNHLEKQAFFGLARDDDRPFVASLEHQTAQSQIETAL
jgi:hypothetical protein